MQSDILYAHNDDLTTVADVVSWVPQNMEQWHNEHGSGTHSGIAVLEWQREAAENREHAAVRDVVYHSSGTSIPAEVLPGEVICKDGIIRRETALVDRYAPKAQKNAYRVSLSIAKIEQSEGKMVLWRPDGALDKSALILEEGE